MIVYCGMTRFSFLKTQIFIEVLHSLGVTTDHQQQQQQPVTMNLPTTPATVKRTGSASNIIDGASPSKRRKMNSNENRSIVEDSDVIMSEFHFIFELLSFSYKSY